LKNNTQNFCIVATNILDRNTQNYPFHRGRVVGMWILAIINEWDAPLHVTANSVRLFTPAKRNDAEDSMVIQLDNIDHEKPIVELEVASLCQG